MGVGHGHGHSDSTATGRHRGRLVAVLAITLVVLAVQVAGGLVSGSLALLADAGHLLSDAAGIGLALLAANFAARPATPERTFGYQRAEILAAVANAVLLVIVAGAVLLEAVRRVGDAPHVAAGPMLAVALVGLVGNAISLSLLHHASRESLNVRGAYVEVLGDLLGSVGVVIAALVVQFTGFLLADVIASVVIGLLILPRTWRLLRDAVDVLLEATPKGVDLGEVRRHIASIPGVVDVHDLHAWTITSGVPVLSAHVVIDDDTLAAGRSGIVLDRLGECLAGHFDVAHCTFQLEPAGHRAHEHGHHD